MSHSLLFLTLPVFCILASCSALNNPVLPNSVPVEAPALPTPETHPPQFTVNHEIYDALDSSESRIEISRDNLELCLLDNQGRIAIRTDCSTGIPGRETPTGDLRIKEKIKDKRSNKYGSYVDYTTGETVVPRNWEVEERPHGTRFLGTPMPYWMRLTWDGVGIHIGKFPRGYPTSFGCIRMPEEIQPLIYAKSRVGTRVKIR